jgi:hypothetical protein
MGSLMNEAQFLGGILIVVVMFVIALYLQFKGLMNVDLAFIMFFVTIGIVAFWAWLNKNKD